MSDKTRCINIFLQRVPYTVKNHNYLLRFWDLNLITDELL